MVQPKSFLNSCLTIALLLAFGIIRAQSGCKDIKATIEVFQEGQKAEKASVKIDFKGQSKSPLEVSLLGPKGYVKRDIQDDEIKELNKGVYTLVITSRREEDGFCLKHFEFTIK